MKRLLYPVRAGLLTALLVILLGGLGTGAFAQGKDSPKAAGGSMNQMSSDDMQKMMAYAVPGEHHKAMDKLVGTWKLSIKMWMGPGDPTATQGTAEYSWILGGRYMQNKQSGDFNGMPYEGMEIDGYDNGKKQYFNVWFDNMGTGMTSSTGHDAADGKGVDYTGSMFDPTQMKDVPIRETMRWTDDTHYTFSMFTAAPAPGGKSQEMKVMEIAAEKQK